MINGKRVIINYWKEIFGDGKEQLKVHEKVMD